MAWLALIYKLERHQASLKDVGVCNETALAEIDVAHMLDCRIAVASAVYFRRPRWLLNIILRNQCLFDVYAFPKRDLGRSRVECAVNVDSRRADAFVPLALYLPLLALVLGLLGRESDFLDV